MIKVLLHRHSLIYCKSTFPQSQIHFATNVKLYIHCKLYRLVNKKIIIPIEQRGGNLWPSTCGETTYPPHVLDARNNFHDCKFYNRICSFIGGPNVHHPSIVFWNTELLWDWPSPYRDPYVQMPKCHTAWNRQEHEKVSIKFGGSEGLEKGV